MDQQSPETYDLARPLLAALFVAAGVYAAHRLWAARRRGVPVVASAKLRSPARQANFKDRTPGEWTPVAFEYPRFAPCENHFSTLKPIPYRPFKWGDYHITMGIRSMAWDEWVEPDRDFPQVHRVVEHRIQTRGDRLVSVNTAQPGVVVSGQAAAEEFLYELTEYLSRRHPDVYSVKRHPVSKREDQNGWYGEGKIREITIIPFEKTYDLEKEAPLKIARSLIQEDFTIMVEGTDGRYYLQAGAMCIAGSWRLEDKLGMALEQIHTSGNVPQFKEKLQLSMDRFFRRLPLDKPVVRNNYSFQVVQEPEARTPRPAAGSLLAVDPEELAWAETMNGSEEISEYERARHVNEQVDAGEGRGAEVTPTPVTVRLRTERQTLRRLPRTGAVVFMIRVYQTKVEDLVREPGVPGRMASALRSWPDDVSRYKAKGAYEGILPYLDQCHAEQIEKGIVSEDEKKNNFPY